LSLMRIIPLSKYKKWFEVLKKMTFEEPCGLASERVCWGMGCLGPSGVRQAPRHSTAKERASNWNRIPDIPRTTRNLFAL
jgi:hypothetical protein